MATRSFRQMTVVAVLTSTCVGCGIGSCHSRPPVNTEQPAAPISPPVSSPLSPSGPRRLLYVFSPDGSYAAFERDTLAAVTSGTLKEIRSDEITVDGIVPDPERLELLLLTPRAWSADASGPSVGLVILRVTRDGTAARLQVVRELGPPTGLSQFLGAMVVGGRPRRLLASWAGSGSVVTLVIDAGTKSPPRRAESFALGPANCATADGARAVALRAGPLETESVAFQDLAVARASVTLPSADFSPIFITGTNGTCRALLVARPQKPSQERVQLPAIIYDLEGQRAIQELLVSAPSNFSLSFDGSLLAAGEKTLVPNVLPSGATVGMKYRTTGVLRLYDVATGQEVAVARLPEDGSLSLLDGSNGYYVSPRLLSVVDLKTGAIAAKAPIPFARGFVAAIDER
jgi:hypothetical protein